MTVAVLLVGALLLCTGAVLGYLAGSTRARPAGPAAASGAELATLIAPASNALARVEDQLHRVERDRVGAYASLSEQVGALHRTSAELGAQTRSLVGALRAPTVRGRWGEVQLQRIVELAGMLPHCDFDVQVSVPADSGLARPDLVVRLAGGRSIPVDAKVPCDAWLQAQQIDDPREQARLLQAHARAVRAQVDALAGKAYWRLFQPAPEFVVMFLPGEPLLDAALAVDPGLSDHAFGRQVIMATPSTLVALLRTVAFTWRQEQLSVSVDEIRRLGRELHERLGTLGEHLTRMGSGLDRAVQAYNAGVGSLESRVLVTARRFTDLGVPGPELPVLEPVSTFPRSPQAPEFDSARASEMPATTPVTTRHRTAPPHRDKTAGRIP